ncbi:hypothetical protein LSH36_807g00119 [Paralvinella palmiformis]|uniref:Uncharacterized protein n=1 Tax=Paralvinella palmiformis TaxID=53620 RepID=A0AAD9J1D6_9ANNE|nr:hypothetical protein LSH36_807g00119 [Paralvinella palmiformis]
MYQGQTVEPPKAVFRRVAYLIRIFDDGQSDNEPAWDGPGPSTATDPIQEVDSRITRTADRGIPELDSGELSMEEDITQNRSSLRNSTTDESFQDVSISEPSAADVNNQVHGTPESSDLNVQKHGIAVRSIDNTPEQVELDPDTQDRNTELSATPNYISLDNFSHECSTRDNNNIEGFEDGQSTVENWVSASEKPRKVLDLKQLKEEIREAKPERELKRELSTIIEEWANEEYEENQVPLKTRKKQIQRYSIYPPDKPEDIDPDFAEEHKSDMTTPDDDSGSETGERAGLRGRREGSDYDSQQSGVFSPVFRIRPLSPLQVQEPPSKPDMIDVDMGMFERSIDMSDPDDSSGIYDDVEMGRTSFADEDNIYDVVK